MCFGNGTRCGRPISLISRFRLKRRGVTSVSRLKASSGGTTTSQGAANMLTPAKPSDLGLHVPFDDDRLDRLMDEAGLDVLVATSKHNVQYLLGGHRALFFDYM